MTPPTAVPASRKPARALPVAVFVLAVIGLSIAFAAAARPASGAPPAPPPSPSTNPSPSPSPPPDAPTQPPQAPGGASLTPAPATPPASTGVPEPDEEPGSEGAEKVPDCGFADVSCKAKNAVNGWFTGLVSAAAKPIFGLLHDTVLGTPEIASDDMRRARQLWGTSQTIANTCFILMITLGGVLLMAGQSLPGAELPPGQLVVRLVAAFLASNLSLILIGYGIKFANGLAGAFLNHGAETINPSVVADVIAGWVAANLAPTQPFTAIVALGVIVLALCVAFIYIIRIAITMVLIAAAPVALMFHALPLTDGLARLWWRGITGILAIQVCQSLVLATAFQLMFSETADTSDSYFGIPSRNDLTDMLLATCLLWVMIRIPSWVARTIWQPAQPRMLLQVAKSFVLYRGLGALMSRTGAGGTGGGGGRRSVPPRDPGPRRPVPPRPPTPPSPPRRPPPPPPPAPHRPRRPMPYPDPVQEPGGGAPPVQLALPIPTPARPASRHPVQLALPIPVTRVPRPPAGPAPAPAARPRVRSGQLMLPGMPRRPVPHRQLTLWVDPPKTSRTRRNT